MKMDDRGPKERQERIEEKLARMKSGQEQEAVQQIIDFNKTPADLKVVMDRFVIGQIRQVLRDPLVSRSRWPLGRRRCFGGPHCSKSAAPGIPGC